MPAHLEDGGVVADVVSTISEAVRALGRVAYDAVLLRVERPDEMPLLCRIRAAAPGAALLALVPEEGREFEELARSSGADAVVPTDDNAETTLAGVAHTLGTSRGLVERSRLVTRETRALRQEMGRLLARGVPVRAKNFELARIPVQDFRPLLVEDDPDQAFLFARSLRKAQLPFPLPVMRTFPEAIAYLAGQEPYGDRTKHPLPTLVLLDVHLPGGCGLEVLKWIRSHPDFENLAVFMLSTSTLEQDIDQAYALGADHYFIKPILLEEMLEQAKAIALRWAMLHRSRTRGEP